MFKEIDKRIASVGKVFVSYCRILRKIIKAAVKNHWYVFLVLEAVKSNKFEEGITIIYKTA